MSHTNGDPGHGHSPAAWTAVVIILVGFSRRSNKIAVAIHRLFA